MMALTERQVEKVDEVAERIDIDAIEDDAAEVGMKPEEFIDNLAVELKARLSGEAR